jgi:N-acetylmuramidase/Putative peptidoglycan binding domain
MANALSDARIRRILSLPDDTADGWATDLARFERGDITLTRRSAGEASIKGIQRLLIFLGYSTASTGAFVIDGDFGRGTNRAVAQFQVEHGLTKSVTRVALCYDCNWQTASQNIVGIPDSKLTPATLSAMLEAALRMVEEGAVLCGDLDEAVFHLDALHRRRLLSCEEIKARYGVFVDQAIASVAAEGIEIARVWPLAIIKQETSGIVRPRFEQHLLTRMNKINKKATLPELRHRSMSMGLGQILGDNFRRVKARSAQSMYSSSIGEQVAQIARFLTTSPSIVSIAKRNNPSEADFRAVARFYNGPGYEKHHYHESLARWFREFRVMAR